MSQGNLSCTGHKSSTHMARTSSTIITQINSIAESIVKHKFKHNQTSFSERKAIKTGSVPQKVNHPHKRTSGQSIANHVSPHCPLSHIIKTMKLCSKTQRNVTRKLVMHKSSTHMERTSSTIITHKKKHRWKHCKTQIQTQPNKFLTA